MRSVDENIDDDYDKSKDERSRTKPARGEESVAELQSRAMLLVTQKYRKLQQKLNQSQSLLSLLLGVCNKLGKHVSDTLSKFSLVQLVAMVAAARVTYPIVQPAVLMFLRMLRDTVLQRIKALVIRGVGKLKFAAQGIVMLSGATIVGTMTSTITHSVSAIRGLLGRSPADQAIATAEAIRAAVDGSLLMPLINVDLEVEQALLSAKVQARWMHTQIYDNHRHILTRELVESSHRQAARMFESGEIRNPTPSPTNEALHQDMLRLTRWHAEAVHQIEFSDHVDIVVPDFVPQAYHYDSRVTVTVVNAFLENPRRHPRQYFARLGTSVADLYEYLVERLSLGHRDTHCLRVVHRYVDNTVIEGTMDLDDDLDSLCEPQQLYLDVWLETQVGGLNGQSVNMLGY